MKLAIALAMLLSASPVIAEQSYTLIGGAPADPKDWPASVYVSMGNGRCSGTIVGPRTLIFAAHCVDNGGLASFTVAGTVYRGKCTHHPVYKTDETSDWALCLLDKAVAPRPFEVLATTKTQYACSVGQDLRLTGFGCIQSDGNKGNDGIFRVGQSQVARCPAATYDIVARGTAIVCFGDSGGSVYRESADGSRVVVGINSRTGVDKDGKVIGPSYLASVTNPSFVGWATDWAANNDNQQICGISASMVGCRNAPTQPQPQPKPTCLDKLSAVKTALSSLDQCLNSTK